MTVMSFMSYTSVYRKQQKNTRQAVRLEHKIVIVVFVIC